MHYAESCRKGLREAGVDLTVEQIVEFGHRVAGTGIWLQGIRSIFSLPTQKIRINLPCGMAYAQCRAHGSNATTTLVFNYPFGSTQGCSSCEYIFCTE